LIREVSWITAAYDLQVMSRIIFLGKATTCPKIGNLQKALFPG